jgi:hypothetical protein
MTSYFTAAREAALDRIHVTRAMAGELFTVTYAQRGKTKTLRHMRFIRADNFGITFYQEIANGKTREHIFDGPELIDAVIE